MLKRLILVCVIILGLFFGTEAFLPKLLATEIAQAMTTLTGSKEVSAKLEKSPAIFMLIGKFDRVTLDAANAKIDKIMVSSMHVVMENIELDEKTLLIKRKAVIKKTGNVILSGVITQQELSDYLTSSIKGISDVTVNIEPEKAGVSGQVTVGGLVRLGVKIEGKIVAGKQKVKFIPERFFINNSPVANNSLIAGTPLDEITLIDSSKLPFGVVIKEVVMQKGQVSLTADNISS